MDASNELSFINEQSDFYCYMVDMKLFKSKQTYHDYITRLRYVSKYFKLDDSLTEDKINEITQQLKDSIQDRDRYNTPKGISDIASGLKRFLEYVQSDYKRKLNDSILKTEQEIKDDVSLSSTEKSSIIKSRIGQGIFRQKLIDYWQGCAVTECKNIPLLMASHIKPWRDSDNFQRLDVYNGLLLTPNLDKLFDKGYITFSKTGRMICSEFLPKEDRILFGVNSNSHLISVTDNHLPYLKYHRENCFL